MATNPYVNKVQLADNTVLIDISSDTVMASTVLSGYTGHDATGAPFTGTYIPPSGAISVVDTSDSHGGTVRTITALDISDTTAVASDVASGKYFYAADGTKTAGTASGGGGGLEYETGTWSPSEDANTGDITFTNIHLDAPAFFVISNTATAYTGDSTAAECTIFCRWDKFNGTPVYAANGSRIGVNFAFGRSAGSTWANTVGQLSNEEGSSLYAKSTGLHIYSPAARPWHANCTYKWIAVWAPTA